MSAQHFRNRSGNAATATCPYQPSVAHAASALTTLWQNGLGRAPTSSETAQYGGASAVALLQDIVQSPEYRQGQTAAATPLALWSYGAAVTDGASLASVAVIIGSDAAPDLAAAFALANQTALTLGASKVPLEFQFQGNSYTGVTVSLSSGNDMLGTGVTAFTGNNNGGTITVLPAPSIALVGVQDAPHHHAALG